MRFFGHGVYTEQSSVWPQNDSLYDTLYGRVLEPVSMLSGESIRPMVLCSLTGIIIIQLRDSPIQRGK